MNKILYVFMIFVLLFLGCSKGKEAASETKQIVKGYAKSVLNAPSKAKVVSDLSALRQTVQEYRVEHSAFPSSLNDLNVKLYYPNEYNYNPNTGEVKSKKYPNL